MWKLELADKHCHNNACLYQVIIYTMGINTEQCCENARATVAMVHSPKDCRWTQQACGSRHMLLQTRLPDWITCSLCICTFSRLCMTKHAEVKEGELTNSSGHLNGCPLSQHCYESAKGCWPHMITCTLDKLADWSQLRLQQVFANLTLHLCTWVMVKNHIEQHLS